MSPQEQAQQIVNAWIAERQRKDRQCWMEPKHTDVLATLIAAALAASAAKVEGIRERLSEREQFIRENAGPLLAERDAKIERQRKRLAQVEQSNKDKSDAIDALTAKLEASEQREEALRELLSHQTDHQQHLQTVVRLTTERDDMRTRARASERALERAKWTLAEIRGLVPAIAPAGDQGMAHLRQIAHLIERALASPEARATGEDSA